MLKRKFDPALRPQIIRTVRDREPRASTSTFTLQLPCSEHVVQCCFMSTETIRTVRDGKSRTSSSTFTQFLSSVKKIYIIIIDRFYMLGSGSLF